MTEPMRGVITPILTPYNDDHSIATDLYLEHAAGCLSEGAHYLSPFGTTSEALSNSSRERMEMLELLISSGVARADQLMPGTGLNCARGNADAVAPCGGAWDVPGVMTLPPFFSMSPPVMRGFTAISAS